MRILLANTLYPSDLHPDIRGGAETFSKRLCEALVSRGHSVRVVRCGPVVGKWAPEKVNGVEIVTLPVRNVYSPWLNRPRNAAVRAIWHLLDDRLPAAPGFDAIIEEFRPDVLHTNVLPGLTVGLWAKAKAHGIPVVHTLHDYYLVCARSLRFSNGDRCAKTCSGCGVLTANRRRAASLVDTVVSVSDRTLAVHREDGVFAKDVSSRIIRNPPPEISAHVSVVQVVDRPMVFGFLGRSCVEKGSFELAKAFRNMPRERARLVIAGHADDVTRNRILQEAGTADVEFLGFVSPERFFSEVDVMVLPSLWDEPSPMTIGEAFAYARPVIGSRRGGIPELINDERAGWLFEPERGKLAGLLHDIAANSEAVMEKSRFLKAQLDRRTFDDLVSDYIGVYQDVHNSWISHHGRSTRFGVDRAPLRPS
jgi:glycosyltransferase involved in cell wall biosynthesis